MYEPPIVTEAWEEVEPINSSGEEGDAEVKCEAGPGTGSPQRGHLWDCKRVAETYESVKGS